MILDLILSSVLLLFSQRPIYALPMIFSIWIVRGFRLSPRSEIVEKALNSLLFLLGVAVAIVTVHQIKYMTTIQAGDLPVYFACCAVFYLLFWWIGFFFLGRLKSKWSHWLVPVLFVSAIGLGKLWPQPQFFAMAMDVFFWICLRNQWFLVTEVRNARIERRRPTVTNSLSPYWNSFLFPINHGRAKSELEYSRLQRSGLYLLLFSTLVGFGLDLVRSASGTNSLIRAICTFGIPQPPASGPLWSVFHFYRTNLFDVFDRWTIVLAGFMFHLVDLFVTTSKCIAIARLCGISVFRHVYRPFESRTFYEALTRTNYHYVQMITTLGMNPLIQSMTWIKSTRWRISLSGFVSIFVIGSWFHFSRWSQILVTESAQSYGQRFQLYLVYFFVIALSAGLSLALNINLAKKADSTTARIMRNSVYFIFYAITVALIGRDYAIVPANDHIAFVLSLFGLTGP